MKVRLFGFVILLIFASCTSKSKVQPNVRCFIKYDSLFSNIQTADLEVIRNTDSAAIEVLDKETKSGQRGLLRFDSMGNLRFYAFLVNAHNDASFIIEYDSLGNHKRLTTNEVVQWNFFKRRDSLLKFEFFLCAIDYNYGSINIEAGKNKIDNIKLLESGFSKLIGAPIVLNYSYLYNSHKIYITGKKQDKCSKAIETFIDSTIIPHKL